MSERLFSALAARAPDAVVLRGATQTWHAAAVLASVAALAERLSACRVLGVLANNSPSWVMADLAALGTATVHLPLPAFFSPSQIAHVLEQTGADALLTDQPERISALKLGFAATGEWGGLVWMQRVSTAVRLPAGTAKISFTSGSTGTPKGACLTAAGLMATASSLTSRLADLPISRHLAVLPLALLLENSAGIYAPLLRGAEIHLPGLQTLGWRGMAGFDPAALQQAITAAQAHSIILVPELLKAWTLFLTASGQAAPGGLAFVAVGGARVDPALLSRARALGIPAFQGYGLTECGSVVCLNRPGDDGPGVGRPLQHVRLRIEDGEVRIASEVFLGYVDDAVPDRPALAEDFATGDLGQLDDNGHLQLSGRRKNLLITSFGRNISPEWVESVLLAQPAIAQAAVTGDARPWLSAVLVAAPGAGHGELEAAVTQANSALPDYARIGGWIASEPFTLQNAQATGNGRPIRSAISTHHAAALTALYKKEDSPMPFYEQLVAATTAEREHLFAAPIIADCLRGRVKPEGYLAFLGQAYHHVRHTTPLLMSLGGRLPERLAWLRRAVAEYIAEEIGHEEWILSDIAAAGGDADAVRASQPDLPAELMVAYAYDLVNRGNPAGFFGMVFVLEGTSVALALMADDRIQQALDLPGAAFSYLRSHGTLDQEHTRHLAELLEQMSAGDQADVVRCARVFYRLYGDIFRALPSAEASPCN